MKITICGENGKMGQEIARLAKQDSEIEIVANGGVMIDFTHSSVVVGHIQDAVEKGCPIVIGTSGLGPEQYDAIDRASKKIPILVAANTSVGANLLAQLVEITAKTLPDADVEIAEIHHRSKVDSPGGTAFFLANSVARARGQELENHLVLDRRSQGPRKSGEISVVAMRGGTAKGDHTVYFLGDNETIELKHHVSDRAVFAEGALKAAFFLAKQPAGLYTMADALKI